MGSPDVVVIGAGFAGLAAATALAEQGATVQVFEARPGLGGRATAFRDPATGERIDNGQHILAGCYVETLRFLERIGATGRVHWPASLRVPMIDERGHASVLSLPPLPSPLHLLAGVFLFNTLVQNFPPDHADSPPRPTAMPVEDVLAAAVAWKRRQEDWLLLKRLMARRDRPRRVRLSDRGTWSGR